MTMFPLSYTRLKPGTASNLVRSRLGMGEGQAAEESAKYPPVTAFCSLIRRSTSRYLMACWLARAASPAVQLGPQ